MDYEPRIVKLEVNVDNFKEELTLLRGQVSALDQKVEALREQSNSRLDDLREHVDTRFSELRAEQIQLRRDLEKLIYWVAGLTMTNVLAIIGLALKAAGAF